MPQRLVNFIARIEFYYLAILPFLGYAAAYFLAPDAYGLMCIPMIGWVFLLIFQIFELSVQEQKISTNTVDPFSLAGILIIATNQYNAGGSLLSYFLEQTILEGLTLIIAFTVVLLFFKNHEGKSSWGETGFLSLFLAAILGLAIFGFISAWMEINIYINSPKIWNLIAFAIGFIMILVSKFRLMYNIIKRNVRLKDPFVSKKGVSFFLIGQIFVWFFLFLLFIFIRDGHL